MRGCDVMEGRIFLRNATPTGESKSDTQPIQSEAWQGSTTDRPLTSRDLFKGRVRLKS